MLLTQIRQAERVLRVILQDPVAKLVKPTGGRPHEWHLVLDPEFVEPWFCFNCICILKENCNISLYSEKTSGIFLLHHR